MRTTKITQTLALAGFAPTGKPGNANQARRRVAAAILRVSASWLACGLAAMLVATAQAQSASEIVLHNFEAGAPNGAYPIAGVIRDSAGNLYGTTPNGGTYNEGVVYKVDSAGHQTVLYNFTVGADGWNPYSGVIQDSAGNLYGTTSLGGDLSGCGGLGCGVVYKLDTAGNETVLYSFTGGADGSEPSAGVIRDSAGNLYGTTGIGGTGAGVVYMLDTAGQETVLYSFTGGADGSSPYAGVIRDSEGNLYGTTPNGGAGYGVVFKLDTAGQETVLHAFTGRADGSYPYNGVIRDSAGNLYGTTRYGGTAVGYNGYGVVFKLDTAGQETVLYTFMGGADGGVPYAGVIRDSAGNLYGTTYEFGDLSASACFGYGCGVVYKLDTSRNETVLYSFTGGADGANPAAGVIRDEAGNLYGTTNVGTLANLGAVYKLNTTGQETVLYGFLSPPDGSGPSAVIRDEAGNLYGTTFGGGTYDAGVVFKLDAGQETVLYAFNMANGWLPNSVIRDPAGNFYGTTENGGTGIPALGVVYELDASGKETVLHSFLGGTDGSFPYGGLIRDSAGNLYGTTQEGGSTAGFGTVYTVNAAGQETVLYGFTGGADGGFPQGVIRDPAGNLYGTTGSGGTGFGVVYELNTGGQKVLHTFTGGADGGSPSLGVILDSAGNLYGTTYAGGTGAGVVYMLDKAGKETVLYTFTGGADGGSPSGGVIRDSEGNLYGTTGSGGAANDGVVFKLDAAGQERVLYSFTGGAGGTGPCCVIRDSAGNLYGTAAGGTNPGGVVFKLIPQ
jgi:uncharacterized repeat protein (TIGR03803 family)